MVSSAQNSIDEDYVWSLKKQAYEQLFLRDDYESASTTITELLTIAPADALVHGFRGHLLLALNRTAEGIAALRYAVELEPEDYDGCLEYGKALYDYGVERGEKNNIGEALTYLRKAAVASPHKPEPYTYIGLCMRNQGDLLSAIEAFQTSITLASSAEEEEYEEQCYNYLYLGNALSEIGRWREAIPMYQRVLQMAPDLMQSAEELAVAYYHEGFLIRAGDIFQKLLPFSQHKSRIVGYLKRIFSETEVSSGEETRYHIAGVENSTSILWLRLGTSLFERDFVSEALSAFYEATKRETSPNRVYDLLRNLLSTDQEITYQETVERVNLQQRIRSEELENLCKGFKFVG